MLRRFLVLVQIFAVPATVFILHAVAVLYLGVYSVFPNFDNPMHFIGGLSAGFSMLLLLRTFENSGWLKLNSSAVFWLLSVALTVSIAVLYEFWEFGMDEIFGMRLQWGLTDTMVDLLLGTLGAMLISLLCIRKKTQLTFR